MGWSIDGRLPEDPELAEKLFTTLGRALFVAASFERKCAFVLQVVTVSERASNRDVTGMSFEDIFAPVNEGSTLLGRTLHGLKSKDRLKDILPVLHRGRVARNHIAHDTVAELGPLGTIGTKAIDRVISELRLQLDALAQADAEISRIVYWIDQEDEPLPVWLDRNYAARLVEWVLDGDANRLREDRKEHERDLWANVPAQSKT
ncbi:MAG TPA: hypothetical protein VHP33_13040 [Polyangiaceae bacterium]|nr:hypothetical protein [Polyangiaceae bacterium]